MDLRVCYKKSDMSRLSKKVEGCSSSGEYVTRTHETAFGKYGLGTAHPIYLQRCSQ